MNLLFIALNRVYVSQISCLYQILQTVKAPGQRQAAGIEVR